MKTKFPSRQYPTLAQRAIELRSLNLPGACISSSGRQLQMRVGISPGRFGRLYDCLLKIKPDGMQPDVIVLAPDLSMLAGGQKIPHTYMHEGSGTRLCLWWPKAREWLPQMKLVDTFIPWTAEWLLYYELWLKKGEWLGGGEHPNVKTKRWARPASNVYTQQ